MYNLGGIFLHKSAFITNHPIFFLSNFESVFFVSKTALFWHPLQTPVFYSNGKLQKKDVLFQTY